MYQITRNELFDSLSDILIEINTNLLVFGSDQLNDKLNIRIFKSTQMYIIIWINFIFHLILMGFSSIDSL